MKAACQKNVPAPAEKKYPRPVRDYMGMPVSGRPPGRVPCVAVARYGNASPNTVLIGWVLSGRARKKTFSRHVSHDKKRSRRGLNLTGAIGSTKAPAQTASIE